MNAREAANRTDWRGRTGRYEVWYLTFADPETAAGFWIRRSLVAPLVGPPAVHDWFTCFPPAAPPWGIKIPGGLLPPPSGRFRGRAAGDGHRAAWDLRLESPYPVHRPLPSLLYLPGAADTTVVSPYHGARITGTVDVDDRRYEIRRGIGTQGHVRGRRHAEAWAWIHATGFREDPAAALSAITARVRRAGRVSPWLTSASLRTRGRRYDATGLRHLLGNDCTVTLADTPAGQSPIFRFEATGLRFRIAGLARAEPERMIRADYVDPDGSPVHCYNSELAFVALRLLRRAFPGAPWHEAARLETDGLVASAEWGTRAPWATVSRHVVSI